MTMDDDGRGGVCGHRFHGEEALVKECFHGAGVSRGVMVDLLGSLDAATWQASVLQLNDQVRHCE
jgi:hypothetical protein